MQQYECADVEITPNAMIVLDFVNSFEKLLTLIDDDLKVDDCTECDENKEKLAEMYSLLGGGYAGTDFCKGLKLSFEIRKTIIGAMQVFSVD